MIGQNGLLEQIISYSETVRHLIPEGLTISGFILPELLKLLTFTVQYQ